MRVGKRAVASGAGSKVDSYYAPYEALVHPSDDKARAASRQLDMGGKRPLVAMVLYIPLHLESAI